jgi:hypothetical protein
MRHSSKLERSQAVNIARKTGRFKLLVTFLKSIGEQTKTEIPTDFNQNHVLGTCIDGIPTNYVAPMK